MPDVSGKVSPAMPPNAQYGRGIAAKAYRDLQTRMVDIPLHPVEVSLFTEGTVNTASGKQAGEW